MLNETMIAPCGLDCALCSKALRMEDPCPGCLGPDEKKSGFCVSGCTVIRCEKKKAGGFRFCDACPDFPCAAIEELETRYQSAYPVKESPIGNLRYIREKGMDAFLEKEKKTWICAQCGGVICVHNGLCSVCGKAHHA